MAQEIKNKLQGTVRLRFEQLVDGAVEDMTGSPVINVGESLADVLSKMVGALAPYGTVPITHCHVEISAKPVLVVDGEEQSQRTSVSTMRAEQG